jgi:hypothetical protein
LQGGGGFYSEGHVSVFAAEYFNANVKGKHGAPVTAGRDGIIVGYGQVTAPLEATTGDAVIVTWGSIAASITAGRDGAMLAVDSVVGSIDAERYAGLITWGSAAGPMVVDGHEGAFAWVYTAAVLKCPVGRGFGRRISRRRSDIGKCPRHTGILWARCDRPLVTRC